MVFITYRVVVKQHGLIFAKYILDGIEDKLKTSSDLKPMKSNHFKSNVERPMYSVLSNQKIIKQFDIQIPSWQYYADKYIESYDE